MARTRYQASYGDLFIQHLEELLSRGGTSYEMVNLARVYDRESGKRKEEFAEWIQQTAAFTCSRCGRVFSPSKGVEEDGYVICGSCN